MIDNYIGQWTKNRLMTPQEFVTERIIGEIKVTLPSPPNDLTQILNHDSKTTKGFFKYKRLHVQKWTPPIIPSDKELKALPSDERIAFIRRELDRRKNGVFFYNNGGIEYLTGEYYFFLTYWKMAGVGLPEFRDSHRDVFYAWYQVEKDEDSYGLAYYCNRRDGKALCLKTKIPTPDGWKTMEDLKIGDRVFDSQGNITNVTFATNVQYDRSCYEVLFSDGSLITADAEHLWIAKDKVSRSSIKHPTRASKDKIVTTEDMLKKLTVGKEYKKENNWSIVNCKPVSYPKKELKIPPYILGLWLGDGSSSKSAITNIDDEIINCWKSYVKSMNLDIKVYGGITYQASSGKSQKRINTILKLLEYYNLRNNKHIPIDYLQSSKNDRMELLKGLMDTDGSSKPNSRSLEYCSKLEGLILNIKELVESLGYKSTVTSKFNSKVNKRYYYIRFGIYNGNYPFKLQRKIDNIKESKNPTWRTDHRYITSIKPIKSVPVKCISVDSADNSYLCGDSFIVTHNTSLATSLIYGHASITKEVHCGIQSKTNEDAKKVFNKIVFSWKKMPYFWKPTDSGDKNPKSALRFEEPSTRSSKGDTKTYKDALDSFIDFASSTGTSYDGDKLERYYCDEFGKYIEGNAYTRWNVVKPCLKTGFKIIGKAIFTTTVEDLEKGGGQAAYDIYKGSDPNNKGEDGRTSSGLYRLFKPAYYGYEWFINEYGYSDIEGAKRQLMLERQGKEGQELAELTRKYPFNVKEAFQSSLTTNTFPIFKIIQQKEYNTEYGKLPRKGNFVWENIDERIVGFKDDPRGKFEVSWMPDEDNRNKFELIRGLQSPLFKNNGAFGVDPFDHRTTVDEERFSKGACAGFRKYIPLSPQNSNCFFLKYLDRPPKETVLYEDLTKAFIFYGMQGLIENQKPGMINWMNDNGYKNYIRRTQQCDYTKSTSRNYVEGVSTSGELIRETMIGGMESYIYDYIGKISPDIQREKFGMLDKDIRDDMYSSCPFDDILTDWEQFDKNKWTIYDMGVASMLAYLAVTPVRKKKSIEEREFKFTVESFFKTHKI